MRVKRFLAGTAAGAVAVGVIGGCAAQQVKAMEPKLELRQAAQHLGEAKQAGFTVKLTGNGADLIAAAKKQDPKFSAEDTTVLNMLTSSSMTIAYDQGGAGAEDDRALYALNIDGVTGTEVRVLDQTMYAKVPVADLAAKFDVPAADLKEMRSGLAGEDPAFGKLLDGQWVSLDVKKLTELAGSEAGLPTKEADAAKLAAELKTSGTNLLDGATVVRDPADAKHLTVTSSTTKAFAEVKRILAAVKMPIGEAQMKPPKDRPIVIDLWVDNGKFTAAEINLLQFMDGATGRAALRIEMSTGAPIDAPLGATAVDLNKLSGLASSALGAGSAATGGLSAGSDDSAGGSSGAAKSMAELLGMQAQIKAMSGDTKPATALAEVVKETKSGDVDARIVRPGVAEVVVGGDTACVKLPKSTDADPIVTSGSC